MEHICSRSIAARAASPSAMVEHDHCLDIGDAFAAVGGPSDDIAHRRADNTDHQRTQTHTKPK